MSDTVNFWLKNAARVPLLTASQEITLGNQVRAWLDAENPDAKTIRRGQKARERMINSNLKLAVTVAKRFAKRITSASAIGFEDLLQESVLGLVRAVEKFDPSRGYKLSTYSFWWCQQAVSRGIQMNAGTIRVPIGVQDTARRWKYRPEGQTLEEFAAEYGLEPQKVINQLRRLDAAQPRSLDCRAQLREGGGSALLDLVTHDDPDIEDIDYADALAHLNEVDDPVLRDALAALQLNQEARPAEMAELLGCSMQASRRRLNDMRAIVREHCPSHIREQICGKEKAEHVNMDMPIPVFEVSPVQEAA